MKPRLVRISHHETWDQLHDVKLQWKSNVHHVKNAGTHTTWKEMERIVIPNEVGTTNFDRSGIANSAGSLWQNLDSRENYQQMTEQRSIVHHLPFKIPCSLIFYKRKRKICTRGGN